MSTQTSPTSADGHAALARTYVETWAAGDRDALGALVTDDVDFAGPTARAQGREAYLDVAVPAAGSMGAVRVLHAIGDDDGAVVLYMMDTGKARIPAAEHLRFRDGRVAWARLIFDTAPLR
jgi:ketosteroid isomerase-like protein